MRRNIDLVMNSSLEGPRALHPGVGMDSGTISQNAGRTCTLAMDKHLIQGGVVSMLLSHRRWLRHQLVEPLGFEKGVIDRHGISRQELRTFYHKALFLNKHHT